MFSHALIRIPSEWLVVLCLWTTQAKGLKSRKVIDQRCAGGELDTVLLLPTGIAGHHIDRARLYGKVHGLTLYVRGIRNGAELEGDLAQKSSQICGS